MLEIGPGDVGVLPAGARTTWHVHETLRKVFQTRRWSCPAGASGGGYRSGHDLDRRRPRGGTALPARAAHRRGRGRPRPARRAAAVVARPRPARPGPGAARDRPADRGGDRGRPAPGAARVRRARRGVPAAGRRLRGDVRRQHRGAPARDDPHAAADGDRAHLRHVDARGQAGPHRRPVREAAQLRHRCRGPALLPGRHGQRAGALRGRAAARRRAARPRLRQRRRGDEPHARDHRRRHGRPPPPARVEHGLRPLLERRRALRAGGDGDRPQPALHVGLRRRRQLAAHGRDVREPRDARARLRAGDAATRGARSSTCSPPISSGSGTARASSTARTSPSPRCSRTRSASRSARA